MKKYEYKYVEQKGKYNATEFVYELGFGELGKLENAVNKLGLQGWELVSVVPCGKGNQSIHKLIAFLKREIESD